MARLPSVNLPVLGVSCIFAFVYLTVLLCVILPWLSYSVPGVMNLAIFSTDTAVAFLCFLFCVCVDPGRVPDGFSADPEKSVAVMEVKRSSGAARFCQKCNRGKPARSHHCRVCGRCVLRMDHHCPWINNCVGHANYKAFLLFLLYASAAVVHAMGLLVAHAIHSLNMKASHRAASLRSGPWAAGTRNTMAWAFVQTVCTALTLPLSIGLVMLLCWNVYLLLCNKTTIEYHEGVTAKFQALRSGQEYRHPYDLGLCSNLYAVFGPKPQHWMFPTRISAHGDGVQFNTIWDTDTGAYQGS
ncbi:hypothetical protein WJX73_003252 [Symbiochloris irregularis]|uniref:S-acyltransferase n=1 Tax=Symbiochloris irregularis TaxID=706552 RepID=A0AAW1NVN6_9CHLO